MKAKPISIGKLMSNLTMHVEITGDRWFKFRLWLGSIFLRLAALVLGCGIEIRRPWPSGYQPIWRGEGEPLPPPRKP